MIPEYLPATWTAFAAALGDHLWQSTLFAVVAGLLTLILRNNHARARYWLWLAASMKFLVPFSLLVAIGSHLPWSRGSAGTKAGLYFAMEEVSQPFSQPAMTVISRVTPSTVSPSVIHLLPGLLAAAWLCGFLVVLSVWYLRWRGISVAIRDAVPLREGREVEALRRLERIGGMRKRIEMLLSRASLEPGIFGIARPVLVWPERISERLEDVHLEAILAHEVWHVRRRDNLAAAIHMAVESVFWFHPLVWWLGARLVEERERACDEEVLELGNERQVYAESILKVCEFCVGSPLDCVSGVTGADLKKRIARIMSEGVACRLDFRRKLLLGAFALVAVAAPVVFGLLQATQVRAQAQNAVRIAPAFDAVIIKPNKTGDPMPGFSIPGRRMQAAVFKPDRFMATNFTLRGLIHLAYGVQDSQILAGPDWLDSEKYDVEAKLGSSAVNELGKLSPDQRDLESQSMLQALLADRFKLTLHDETKEVPAYVLVIAKGGPKLTENTYRNGVTGPDGLVYGGGPGIFFTGPSQLAGQRTHLGPFVGLLSGQLGRPVIDKTGLTGVYDFTLDWLAPLRTLESAPSLLKAVPEHAEALTKVHAIEAASLLEAVSEQLGLELNLQTAPVEILVIDHVERPSEN